MRARPTAQPLPPQHDPDIAKILDGANGDPNVIRQRMREAMAVKPEEMVGETSGEDTAPKARLPSPHVPPPSS